MKSGHILTLLVLVAGTLSIEDHAFAMDAPAASKKPAGNKALTGKKRNLAQSKRNYLVPPPPPTAVSPVVLASYGRMSGATAHFLPSKPRNLADGMRLTAVMDDVAFFKVPNESGSIHLKKGGIYQSVKVAQINPEEVILEEKGIQFVKYIH